jgi:hypothetical protein
MALLTLGRCVSFTDGERSCHVVQVHKVTRCQRFTSGSAH